MIETYKIVSGKYDSTIALALLMSDTHITRGNELRLQKFRCKYDMRKFYFTNRVQSINQSENFYSGLSSRATARTTRSVDHWNSLPNWVVSANNIITFKKT